MNERSFIYHPDAARTVQHNVRARRGRPPSRGRRGRVRRETRREILDAAAELFLLFGYNGSSMRNIAVRAGVSASALYNHFANKEAIFVALLLERAPQRLAAESLAGVGQGSTPAMVAESMDRLRRTLRANWANLRLVLIEMVEWQGRHVGSLMRTAWPALEEFLRKLEASRPGLRRLPRPFVARAFLGLVMSYALTAALLRRVPGFKDSDADWARLADAFLYGVARRPPRP